VLTDIQTYLVTNAIGTLPENRQTWPIFLHVMPDDEHSTDRCICLCSIPGAQKPDQWGVIFPRLLVYVRGGKDYDIPIAEAKIDAIFNLLHSSLSEVGANYRSILATTPKPLFLGVDSKRRPRFSTAFNVILEPQ